MADDQTATESRSIGPGTPPIGVVGLGTVGIATAVHLAEAGCHVRAVDADPALVASLREGVPVRHGAEMARAWHAARERIDVSQNLDDLDGLPIVFVAIGVPPDTGDGTLDASGLTTLIDRLTPLLAPDGIVVVRSTVPIGTVDALNSRLGRARPSGRVAVVANPEFLSEGSSLEDARSPARVVLGGPAPAVERLAAFYLDLVGPSVPIVRTDARSAEAIKLVSNAMLASRVAFANEIADLVEATGGDVDTVLHGVGLDPRIGPTHLRPGPGFGGSCFPKDVAALAAQAVVHERPMRLVEATLAANATHLDRIMDRIAGLLGGILTDRRIALLGLAFKAGTSDARGSPAVALADRLVSARAIVRAYDPAVRELSRTDHGTDHDPSDETSLGTETLIVVASAADAIMGSELTIVATEWPAFRTIDYTALAPRVRAPVLLDLRRMLEPGDPLLRGWAVHRVGDPSPMDADGVGTALSATVGDPAAPEDSS